MTAPALEAVRLSLHVLAATIWVGGQFTLAGLVPTLRSLGPDAPRTVARAFSRLLWPAFGVLVLTGIWNIQADHTSGQGHVWNAVLGAKIAVVLLSGVAAAVHQRARSPKALAVSGGISGLAALGALVLGVVLAG